MTGKERTLCAINFEPTDRIPVVGGWLLNFSSSLGPEVPEDNIRTYFEAAQQG